MRSEVLEPAGEDRGAHVGHQIQRPGDVVIREQAGGGWLPRLEKVPNEGS
jgi:hypothetical protein